MKMRLFTEDPDLTKSMIDANPQMGEAAIPVIELNFGYWHDAPEDIKTAILGYTARFCSDVFRAFVLDAIHKKVGWPIPEVGHTAIQNALDSLEKTIRESMPRGHG